MGHHGADGRNHADPDLVPGPPAAPPRPSGARAGRGPRGAGSRRHRLRLGLTRTDPGRRAGRR
ncbi:MAG: hypothetical protein D6683_09725 [Actinomyces sp.]|nr:MAG: hypothetical protein D6683_09725 [Actinomyces sp.]